MAKPKDDTKDLYLYVKEERSAGWSGGDQYFHLHARVCTQKFEDHAWRPYGPDDTYSDGFKYDGLRVSCQGDRNSQLRPTSEGAVYGWDCAYRDVYSVDLSLAKRMVRTLAHIDRRLDAIRESRGYVKSYGEYVGRVAEALGCKGIAIETTKHAREVSGALWGWKSIGEGVNAINHRIWDWQQEAVPKAAAADTDASAAEVAS